MLPSPGTYRAKQNGIVIVRKEETGSIMAYIPYVLTNCQESPNFSEVHNLTLCAKDGTLQQRSINYMRQVFQNWDGENLADIEMPAEGEEIPTFDLADCFHDDSYTPEGASEPLLQFKAKWFNPPGGGRKQSMTEAERKSAIVGWKAKYKAMTAVSGKPATVTKPATAQPAAAKPAVKGPPGRKPAAATRTSDANTVFEAICTANPENDDAANGQAYYDACDAVVEGSSEDPSKLTPENWGQILTNIGL